MKELKRLGLLAIGMVALTNTAFAQDEVEATLSADFVNQYIWRGQKCGEVSVQPTLGISYKGFSLTAWGSTELVDQTSSKELDLTLAYTIGGFNIGITDYYFDGGAPYFKYAAHETSHVFEANIGYDFGPVAIQWFTNFAGADGVNGDGDRAYSSYFEISAPFTLGGIDWSAAIGAVPYETSFYSDAGGFAVTNVTLSAGKDLKITDKFSLPLFAGITANPSTRDAYFTFGFTFNPFQ